MKKKEKILRAFLEAQFTQQGWEPEESVLNAIVSNVKIEEGTPLEDQEVRTIKIMEDTDDKISAQSIKLYNLLNVSYYDLFGFSLKESTILLTEDVKVKILMSLLNLIYEFYPKLTYKFNEKDSKILLLVYGLNGASFDANTIADLFKDNYKERIEVSDITRSLSFLTKMKVLKYIEKDNQYVAKERMIYERN